MDNEALKQVFKDLHPTIIRDVNPDSVIDHLLSKKVINEDDYLDLCQTQGSRNRCRKLFALLYPSSNPETFIQVRLALLDDYSYSWIVDEVDKQLPSATAQLHLGDTADGRQIFFYQLIIKLEVHSVVKLSSTTLRGQSGHTLKIYKPQVHLDVKKFFFTVRIIDVCNSLPISLINNCETTATFKKHLDCLLKNRGYI